MPEATLLNNPGDMLATVFVFMASKGEQLFALCSDALRYRNGHVHGLHRSQRLMVLVTLLPLCGPDAPRDRRP